MAAVAEDKGKLGELVAFQIVRGTRWMDEYSALTVNVIEGWRRDKKVTADDHEIAASTEELAEAERVFLTDTYRLTRMMIHGRKLATVLASMHWTLVEFISPVVATSDHPVVFWPADVPSRVPQATPLSVGIINCSEIRLPLSPRHVVLMTWADDPDDEPARVRGTRSHAVSINAFTVKQADRQWFHLPRTAPPIAAGNLLPIASDLVDGYTPAVAASSRRRVAVNAEIQPKIGRDNLADEHFPIVRVHGRPPEEL